MREGHPERDIGVMRSADVRYAEVVALDPRVILSGFGDQTGRIGRGRLAQAIGHDQEYGRSDQQQRQSESGDLQVAHGLRNGSAIDRRLRRGASIANLPGQGGRKFNLGSLDQLIPDARYGMRFEILRRVFVGSKLRQR